MAGVVRTASDAGGKDSVPGLKLGSHTFAGVAEKKKL